MPQPEVRTAELRTRKGPRRFKLPPQCGSAESARHSAEEKPHRVKGVLLPGCAQPVKEGGVGRSIASEVIEQVHSRVAGSRERDRPLPGQRKVRLIPPRSSSWVLKSYEG